MGARNHILALLAAAAFLSTTGAMAQTEGKLFEGASTYYLVIDQSGSGDTEKCDLSEDFLRSKLLFPLSYSTLKEGGRQDSDIYLVLGVWANKMILSETCYGTIVLTAKVFLFDQEIPFNKKNAISQIQLFNFHGAFTGSTTSQIGVIVEELAKRLVTAINMDNK